MFRRFEEPARGRRVEVPVHRLPIAANGGRPDFQDDVEAGAGMIGEHPTAAHIHEQGMIAAAKLGRFAAVVWRAKVGRVNRV